MKKQIAAALLAAAVAAGSPYTYAQSIKTEHTGGLKGKNTLALGAFRVVFVISDSIAAESFNSGAQAGIFGSSSSKAEGDAAMVGLKPEMMQKITDELYAQFLDKAKSSGYSVIDSRTLAERAPEYASLDMTENNSAARWGIYVVPTGQTSAALPADESKELGRGSKKSVFSGFKANGQKFKKGEVDQVLPAISQKVDAPVMAVTYVVSFAKFKSNGRSHFGQSAHFKIEYGATLNGFEEQDPMATGIQFWDKDGGKACGMCTGSLLALKGDVHSEANIGTVSKYDAKTNYEGFSNTMTYLNGGGNIQVHKGYIMTIDPALYEKNVLEVGNQTNGLLFAAMLKER